jgi:hypothetical protein
MMMMMMMMMMMIDYRRGSADTPLEDTHSGRFLS